MTIKTTHIDNCSHGYLSVSKKDFLKVCEPHEITPFSGHDLTRIYLEEDCDASTFLQKAEQKGIEIIVKSSYNPKFNKTKNYNPELFNYKPQIGDVINQTYKVQEVHKTKLIVVNGLKKQFKISLSNPFKHIQEIQHIK